MKDNFGVSLELKFVKYICQIGEMSYCIWKWVKVLSVLQDKMLRAVRQNYIDWELKFIEKFCFSTIAKKINLSHRVFVPDHTEGS